MTLRSVARALLLCSLCTGALAETLLVGPAGVPASLAEAVAAAKDGDVVEMLPGEYKGEVLMIPPRRLTIRGVGQRPVVSADGKIADGKGLWVVEGGDVTIENVEFRGARAPDADGAGVVQEGGRLRVVDSAFFDNEHGLLTGNAADAELVVENSVFAQAPRIVGGLCHLLVVGRIKSFTVTGSRFHQGFEGHMIKSHAQRSRIAYNLIYDASGEASYEVDLPNGGEAWLIGNVIGQSPRSQNPVVVAYGAEDRPWPKSALYMAHNTLVNNRWLPAWFLRVFRDRLPEGTPIVAVNNLTVGGGVFGWGARGRFEGNWPALRGALVDPDTMAFDLPLGSWLRDRGVDPRDIDGQDLSPTAEFKLPVGTRPLPPLTRWTPGAFQH